jgi:copper transport protein
MQRRYLRFGLIGVGIIVGLFASSLPDSFAHPAYVKSTPQAFQTVAAPPPAVNVFFTEPIELKYSKISVIGPDGNRVDNNDPHNVDGDTASLGVSLQPGIPDGTYTVSTSVLSAVDGHLLDNAFTFGVGLGTKLSGSASEQQQQQTQALLSIPAVASRYPGMVGLVMIVGGAFASLWLWKPIARVPWLSDAIAQKKIVVDKAMVKFIIVGVILVLASGVAMILVQAISIGGSIPDAVATKFGNVWLSRMLQSAILAAIAFSVYRKVVRKNVSPARSETVAILILGLATLVTNSLIAHAAATSQISAIVLDFFHNSAAAIWIGGLILLGFVAAPRILEIADEKVKATAISLLIPRFSIIVVTILGVIAITGPLLLYSIESDLSLILASLYGKFLIFKLSLAGVMVGMGAYSQFAIQKKAVSVVNSGGGGGGGTSMIQTRGPNLKHFGKFLKVEAAVGIGLLLMVTFMANSSVPSGQFPAYESQKQLAAAGGGGAQTNATSGQPSPLTTDFVQTAYVDNGGKIRLAISPFDVGQNNFKISFLGTDGTPVSSIDSATIKMTQTDKSIGPIAIDTQKQSDGVFASNASFGVAGKWDIIVEGVNSKDNNMIASLDLNVKPQVSNLDFAVKQYDTPTSSMPLFPVFDAERQSIWVGDSLLGSGRIWQLNIATGNYTSHSIKGANIVTQMVLAPDGKLWYIDPLAARPNSTLGVYDPDTGSVKQFVIPIEGISTGIAMDSSGNLWVPISQANKVVKFMPQTEQFASYDIPTAQAEPVGIMTDSQGNIWFAEAIGKIAKIDVNSGNITEYAPKSGHQALDEPTAIFEDQNNPGTLYISEHTGHTVTAFNTLLGTFHKYPSLNEAGLPFGMAMDNYGNLWVAEHQIDKIAVIDPRTGASKEANIPITGSFIQWITSDDDGRIWFAAQQGSGLGSITITAKPSSPLAPSENGGGGEQQAASSSAGGVPQLGFSFAAGAGPGIAAGIVLSALFYAKSSIDLNRNVRTALRLKT